MLGPALKKFATENGLSIDQGVPYGNYRGFAVTLFEGAGTKTFVFTGRLPSPQKAEALRRFIEKCEPKEYRLTDYDVTEHRVELVFFDNPGTMKKVDAFLNLFIPALEEVGMGKAGTCALCGREAADGSWKAVDDIAYYLDSDCASTMNAKKLAACSYEEVEDDAPERVTEQKAPGNGILIGVACAVVGVVLGYFITTFFDLFFSFGLGIGLATMFLWKVLRGPRGKKAVPGLAIAILGGCLLGTVADGALMNMTGGSSLGEGLSLWLGTVADGSGIGAALKNFGVCVFITALISSEIIIDTKKLRNDGESVEVRDLQ